MEIVLWSIALLALSSLGGITFGRRSRNPEIRQLTDERDRLKALFALAGDTEPDDFYIQKKPAPCPSCQSNQGSYPDCNGRCPRGNNHVHVRCGHCGLEWVRVI